ncbi:ACT domain-containing protein [Endozoicomonas sp. SM1973]|uniref:ACT domain-containing protein n=1 Tax=Spartinivicinus marinus TaxID=2994442 RepID=A0A853IN24_9GAMM|nr:ACT domain-containing protein [Spartinivicinus marinus]MCX4027367.1 ACT domain-containing protein [Spartinivicinus marinus]NYZ69216.1 ACT domain-containing protein [Spartinivicinus marinus]
MIVIKDLNQLLMNLKPVLVADEFVFCTLKEFDNINLVKYQPIATFREMEGITLVLKKETAVQQSIAFDSVYKMITLQVHSSLDAVGLTAVVSRKLADNGISANMFAGYYHDHIFIQSAKAEEALLLLAELATESALVQVGE